MAGSPERSYFDEEAAADCGMYSLNPLGKEVSASQQSNDDDDDRQPDNDSIIMFVGQIPRTWTEKELNELFVPFGEVFEISLVKDWTQKPPQSRGCCFVTFYTRKAAIESQNALHNIKILPGMYHPVQMKPADNERSTVEERKLFVGMLSKDMNDDDVRALFVSFGVIEDCKILRGPDGESKACAFLTFSNKTSAHKAIKVMHRSKTMENCSGPLVVKFADTAKERELKRFQQKRFQNSLAGLQQSNPGSAAASCLASLGFGSNFADPSGLSSLQSLGQQYLSLLQQALSNSNNQQGSALTTKQLQVISTLAAAATMTQGASSNLGGMTFPPKQTVSGEAMGSMQSLPGYSGNSASGGMSCLPGLGSGPSNCGEFSHYNGMGSGPQGSRGHGLPLGGGQGMGMGMGMGGGHLGSLAGGLDLSGSSSADTMAQAYSGMQQYANLYPGQGRNMPQYSLNTNGSQKEGPEGANLFVYHVPQEFGDADLVQMFVPFGNVVSAKVFIDRVTKISKCFDSPCRC
uniref:RRM domain-containing protein n=1 Tax=Eptatretus burgeri TaxID=7764 RepID=A0A8C4QBB1_EPTBU